MSGTPPYTYLQQGANLVALGQNALLYLYDGESAGIITVEGETLFEPGCYTARLVEDINTPALSHPIGSYNIAYPYCRTALQFDMADTRGDPQIGQLVVAAPFLSLLVILVGCDQSDILSIAVRVEPGQVTACGIEMYPDFNDRRRFYIMADLANLSLPARLTFTVTNANGTVKEFWIGLRDSRGGLPSGALV